MSDNLIKDAFKSLSILNEDTFDLNKSGIDELEKFLDGDYIADTTEYIIDPEAADEEELEKSYVDKVVLSCDVCRSLLYKDQDDIIIDDETQLANVGESCPFCQSEEGFKVVGMVMPYAEDATDTDVDDIEEIEVKDEEDISLEEALKTLNEDVKNKRASLKRSQRLLKEKSAKLKMINLWDRVMGLLSGTELEYKLNKEGKKIPAHSKILYPSDLLGFSMRDNAIFVWVADEEDAKAAKEIADRYGLETKLSDVINGVKGDKNRKFFIYIDPDKEIPDDHSTKPVNERLTLKKKLKEDFQKISIENKDTITTVDTDEEGKTTVSTEPKKDEELKDSTEVIKPLPTEIKDEIETNGEETEVEETPEEVDVDIEEFDEEDFDNLGESYFRRVYDNIKSYKTTSGRLNENKIMLEGLLTFKSGKTVKTNFIFESHYQTKKGKLKFLGENVQISPNKRAFTLTGHMEGKKLITEALTYNYCGKDAKTGTSAKLYGTVKNRRNNTEK